ncbi:hypothetical protein J2S17_000267 [Cytobacillus purgationiresistens]|uniref:Uncharacterized protein n=1 Tax=Cytobacillus purgationiresistens TaxID=863449 RepID=A0ABU0AD87_9BACI|nr:hypothetical protein [Cytobacillus purgationiresistens]
MLNEEKENEWIFRRDPSITNPIEKVIFMSEYNMPYLNPAIVLLYISKKTRKQDHHDFENIVSHVTMEQSDWLYSAIQKQNREHPWLLSLI